MDDVETKSDVTRKPENPSKSSSFENNSPIAAVLEYWKDFDLENARSLLDDQGMKIAEHQESSSKNRKKLAEGTRDFRKAAIDQKNVLFGPLLKSYQEEVDNITKRAKFAETSFLNLYQKLYEAPDPVPCLQTATAASLRVSELEQENRKMRQELDEFRAEASHLKNQQATVRRLEERNRQLELQMEEKVKEMVAMKQQVMAEESQKSLEALKEREGQLHDQLRAAKESVRNMQKLHELSQSQIFELQAKSDEDQGLKQSELNLLTDEVDRATARLLSLEREKENLKAQLAVAYPVPVHVADQIELEASNRLEASLAAKEKQISDLHSELNSIELTLSAERENHLSELKKLHSVLDEKEAKIGFLQEELNSRPTSKLVEDLKKQVKILQAVGYNAVESEDWDEPGNGLNEMGRLETLLLEKNRKIEHDMTQLKVTLAEKTDESEKYLSQLQSLQSEFERQKNLIAKLEEDIVKGYAATDRQVQRLEDWEAPEATISDLLKPNSRGSAAEDNENSMLAVVCGQRDRFRQKMVDLEEELRRVRDRCSSLGSELDRTKTDNVKLYEKIRYVHEYNKERGSSKKELDLEVGSVDVEAKYRKLYEDNINPFAAFSNKEREQRYKDLGFRDRITLKSGRFLMGNKYARAFVFFYSIGLHLLVFYSMYQLSHFGSYSMSATYNSSELSSKKGALEALKRAMAKSAFGPPASLAAWNGTQAA